MQDKVQPIPEGYHSITPAITCKNAASAIDFYKEAFGATEINRMPGPGGMIMHSELRIGDSVIFVSDEFPGMSAAPTPGATPSYYLFLYAPDVDTIFNRAVAAGAQVACQSWTCSGAIATASSPTRSATAGASQLTSKTSLQTKWHAARPSGPPT